MKTSNTARNLKTEVIGDSELLSYPFNYFLLDDSNKQKTKQTPILK